MSGDTPLSRLAVALDTSNWAEFGSWCARFGPRVGVLKVGLEAYVRWGPRAVETARRTGAEVFLDLKLHDIPNTVAGAVRAAAALGVRYLTVHAAGGSRMLSAASEAAPPSLGVLAVTVLTHLDIAGLEELGLPEEPAELVARWACLAAKCGCAGAVCSPLEVATLRRQHPPPFRLVTPGIRWDEAGTDDQRRTATPGGALEAGADLLVVGRPVTRSADPDRALDELARALRRS